MVGRSLPLKHYLEESIQPTYCDSSGRLFSEIRGVCSTYQSGHVGFFIYFYGMLVFVDVFCGRISTEKGIDIRIISAVVIVYLGSHVKLYV